MARWQYSTNSCFTFAFNPFIYSTLWKITNEINPWWQCAHIQGDDLVHFCRRRLFKWHTLIVNGLISCSPRRKQIFKQGKQSYCRLDASTSDSLFLCLLSLASPDIASVVGDSPNFRFDLFYMVFVFAALMRKCENAHKDWLRLDWTNSISVWGFVTFKMVSLTHIVIVTNPKFYVKSPFFPASILLAIVCNVSISIFFHHIIGFVHFFARCPSVEASNNILWP